MSAGSTSTGSGLDLFPLSVYPNPSTGRFLLAGESPSADVLRLSVFNHLGQQVIPARVVQPAAQWREEIDLGDQPDGMYHLRVSDGTGSVSRQCSGRGK